MFKFQNKIRKILLTCETNQLEEKLTNGEK